MCFCSPSFVHVIDRFDYFFCILCAFCSVCEMVLYSHIPPLCYGSQRVDTYNLSSVYCYLTLMIMIQVRL